MIKNVAFDFINKSGNFREAYIKRYMTNLQLINVGAVTVGNWLTCRLLDCGFVAFLAFDTAIVQIPNRENQIIIIPV